MLDVRLHLSVNMWTHQPGLHRRKATLDFSSTFLLRCLPLFFYRRWIQPSLSLLDREVDFCVPPT